MPIQLDIVISPEDEEAIIAETAVEETPEVPEIPETPEVVETPEVETPVDKVTPNEPDKGDTPAEQVDVEFDVTGEPEPGASLNWDKVAEEAGITERGEKEVKERFKSLVAENTKLAEQVESIKIFAQSGSIIAELDKILAMDDEAKIREHLKREGRTPAQIEKRIAFYEERDQLAERAMDVDDQIEDAKVQIMANAEKFRKEQQESTAQKTKQFSQNVMAEIPKLERIAGVKFPTDTTLRDKLNNQVAGHFNGEFQKRLQDPARLASLCAADLLLPQLEKMMTDRVKNSVKAEIIERQGNPSKTSKPGVVRPNSLKEAKDDFEEQLDELEKILDKTPLRRA